MTASRPTDVDDLIAEFVQAAEQGHAPDPEDWLARHPEHAAELAPFLDDLRRFAPFLGLPHFADADLTADGPHVTVAGSPSGSDVGESFGGYQLLGEIGSGGMGIVYRARLNGTTLIVALKQIRSRGQGEAAAHQFRKEIDSVAALRHPNIVSVYHVGEHERWPFYTMSLLEGGSLDQHLDRFRHDAEATATLMAKTARAVQHAHQRQILHRDLKPSNVLLDESGEPHVADFGLAARMDESGAATESGPPGGSLSWMAPEAVRGDTTLTTAVDVWALGVILYELLTGQRPFCGSTCEQLKVAILDSEPAPPRAVNPWVPKDLDAVCQWCMKKDLGQRYESASAVAVELERWLHDEPIRKRRPGRWEQFARWCRRNEGLAIAALILFAVLVAGATTALSLIRAQDEFALKTACRESVFAAELVAGAFRDPLREYGDILLEAVDDQWFLRACADQDMTAVRHFLRNKGDTSSGSGGVKIVSMVLLDDKGNVQEILTWPKGPEPAETVGQNWKGRDYFLGARDRAYQKPRDRVHVSKAFKSQNDQLDKLAVSVAFHPPANTGLWVLTATLTTDSTLDLGVRDDERHSVVLLAPPDPDAPPVLKPLPPYVVVVHPSYEPRDRMIPFHGTLRPVVQSDGSVRYAPDDNYQDPVGETDSDFAGRWIAGFAPVEGTELVVLVQQRYDDVVKPQRKFVRDLGWVGGLVAAGLLAFVSVRLVRTRRSKTRRRPKN
jgi:eukaryotic-like serine/threonine-protein kinase